MENPNGVNSERETEATSNTKRNNTDEDREDDLDEVPETQNVRRIKI